MLETNFHDLLFDLKVDLEIEVRVQMINLRNKNFKWNQPTELIVLYQLKVWRKGEWSKKHVYWALHSASFRLPREFLSPFNAPIHSETNWAFKGEPTCVNYDNSAQNHTHNGGNKTFLSLRCNDFYLCSSNFYQLQIADATWLPWQSWETLVVNSTPRRI